MCTLLLEIGVNHSSFFSESLSRSHSLRYVQCRVLELNNKLWAQVSPSYCPEEETDWETLGFRGRASSLVFLGSARKGGLSES